MARADQSGDWWGRFAPTIAEIHSLAVESLARLPEKFRALCGDLAIHLVDFPDDQLMEDLNLDTPFDLLGFFEGSGVGQIFSVSASQTGNHLWLFRRAILDDWAQSDETLGDLITHILILEIGHHFGLSEQELDTIESSLYSSS